MAKGMSPLRLFMRNTPKRTVSEDGDGSSSERGRSATTAQARQPLGPILETGRNPLPPPVMDLQSPKQPTPIAKAKGEKFPHLENCEGALNRVNETAITSTVPVNSTSKFTWHRHGQSSTAGCETAHLSSNPIASNARGSPSHGRIRSQQDTTAKQGQQLGFKTPPRPATQLVSDVGQADSNGLRELQAVGSCYSKGPGAGGLITPGATFSATLVKPRSAPGTYVSLSQMVTPSKTVSRSLRYGQQVNPVSSGNPEFTGVRSTISQHVITRPVGLAQPLKRVASTDSVEQHFDLEEDPSFWRDHNVQILIRTRPISSSELAVQGSNRCLRQESPHTLIWLGQPESRFTFDHVVGETVTQTKLFAVAGLPMVENCMSGYNSCIFAYGQTGSGKTHTMLGDIEDLDRNPGENRGITPRVFEYLFGRIRMEQETRRQERLRFFCKCSFLEIYNEQITDLLEPSSTNLQLREDSKTGVYVENLSEVEVKCLQDVIQLLLQGAINRKVAATNLNRESSRSHSVFTCVVESKWETQSMTNSRYGRLHLVDLAGSERQKSSGAEGGRLREAASINKSLSTLGLVIMVLVDVANGKQRHVPYRDSKLTFLLQDSLGGNSKTIMIATVSPSGCCAMETLSTLKFAQRAKFVRNNAVVNENASEDVTALRQQIRELNIEVDRLRLENLSTVRSVRPSVHENEAVEGDETGDKKLKLTEAVLAAALRREQSAVEIAKKLAVEIEQLNRLVQQREEESQCSKMILRFREDKIRRLESVADNVLSVDTFNQKEREALMDELQLIRGRLDRNPELTRFAMENIRLMEELRRYQEFYDLGERDLLLEEISSLRSQLLENLHSKLAREEYIANLSILQDSEVSSKELCPQVLQQEDVLDPEEQKTVGLLTTKEDAVRRQDGWENLQESHLRHYDEILQLKLKLEALAEVLKEEQQQRVASEHKSEDLSRQLSAAISKLDQDKCLVVTLEGQESSSSYELENVHAEHRKVQSCLKHQHEGDRALGLELPCLECKHLTEGFRSEFEEMKAFSSVGAKFQEHLIRLLAMYILEQKFQKAERKEEVEKMNRKFQEDRPSLTALEATSSEMSAETALVFPLFQSETLNLRDEVATAVENDSSLKQQFLLSKDEVEQLQQIVRELHENIKCLIQDSKCLPNKKAAEIELADVELESSTTNIQNYPTDEYPRHTEGKVGPLSLKLHEGICKYGDGVIQESKQKFMAAFVMVEQLLDKMEELGNSRTRFARENQEGHLTVLEDDNVFRSLQHQVKDLRSQFAACADVCQGLQTQYKKCLEESDSSIRNAEGMIKLSTWLEREGNYKTAAENFACLEFQKMELDKEIWGINVGAMISFSKGTQQQVEINLLREAFKSWKVKPLKAQSNFHASEVSLGSTSLQISELQVTIEHPETTFDLEKQWEEKKQKVLLKRLQEVQDSSAARSELRYDEDGATFSQSLLKVTASLEPVKQFSRDFYQELQTLQYDNETLRAKICDQENTILSARREMEIAIADLKDAELEIEKVHREKERLIEIHQEDTIRIEDLTFRLESVEEELIKSGAKIKSCEAELQKVAVVSDGEWKMQGVEMEWSVEKQACAQELSEAKLDATAKKNEAAALLEKFQAGQETLKEAEDLLYALVRANEHAKENAQYWKNEKESLGLVQGWWMPERGRLVSEITGLEEDMCRFKEKCSIMWNENVLGLGQVMVLLETVNQEVVKLKDTYEQEMELLVKDILSFKCWAVEGLEFPRDLQMDLEALFTLLSNQRRQLMEMEGERMNLTLSLRSSETLVQLHQSELLTARQDLETTRNDLHAWVVSLQLELQEKNAELANAKQELRTIRDAMDTSVVSLERQLQDKNAELSDAVIDISDLQVSLSMSESKVSAVEEVVRQNAKEILLLNAQLTDSEGERTLLIKSSPNLKDLQALLNIHETVMDTVTICETLISNIPDVSLGLELLSLSQAGDQLSIFQDFECLKKDIFAFLHAVEEELQNKRVLTRFAEDLLGQNLILENIQCDESVQRVIPHLKAVQSERDRFQTDLVVLAQQLEVAQAIADERDICAAEARQIAEKSTSLAQEKANEAKILGSSIEELESTVYALESQLGMVKRESERQHFGREALEKQLDSMKQHIILLQDTLESTGFYSETESGTKSKNKRMALELQNQETRSCNSIESLQQECARKDVQLKIFKYMVEHMKVEESKSNTATTTVSLTGDKTATSKAKGPGSPFKCIGSGLAQQRTSEINEELSTARKRIRELEALAASRQKEVFMLNTKLAEAESMTHDVVRDLLGVKMDIASYATLLNQQQVQKGADTASHWGVEALQKEEELNTLRGRLNEFIKERERWLEEINHTQADAVAARLSAEKLRSRDETLTGEIEKFKVESVSLKRRVIELEGEVEKLSHQQNFQQRIHHHAKIKEENNFLKLRNDELNGKIRMMEILFSRANDELSWCRTSQGKGVFVDFDMEGRVQKKVEARGVPGNLRDDEPCTPVTALKQIHDRQK